MKVILRNNKFTVDKIQFKHNKNSIKLLYDIMGIYMIGIPIKIEYDSINVKGYMLYINISKKSLDIVKKIDDYFSQKIKNYKSFLYRNILKVKKHDNFILDKKNEIMISINYIKDYKDNNYTHIFTI